MNAKKNQHEFMALPYTARVAVAMAIRASVIMATPEFWLVPNLTNRQYPLIVLERIVRNLSEIAFIGCWYACCKSSHP